MIVFLDTSALVKLYIAETGSCALMLRDEDVDVLFATSDQRLLEAARGEGLTVFDPAGPPSTGRRPTL